MKMHSEQTQNKPRINFSHLRIDFQYKFVLHDWKQGELYLKQYVLFDASFDFDDELKGRFELCLPANKIVRAIEKVPVAIKQNKNLRITLTKHKRGYITIDKIEKYI